MNNTCMVWSGPRYKMYQVVHGMKWSMVWNSPWYEVTSGMKWPRVWSASEYEVTQGMKWLQVWSDSKYEVTPNMKWLKVWSDSRYEVNMGCSEHIFSLWYEVTPKMKWTWYEMTGYLSLPYNCRGWRRWLLFNKREEPSPEFFIPPHHVKAVQ